MILFKVLVTFCFNIEVVDILTYSCDLDLAQLWLKILITLDGWVGSQALNLMMKGSMVINSHT